MIKKRSQHKALEWIKTHCVFPDSAGKYLARKPVGAFLLPFQTRIIKQVLAPDFTPKKNLFIFGCRKVSKTFLFSLIIWALINDKKRRGFNLPVMASVFPQAKLLYNQMICQPHKREDVRFYLEKIKQKQTKAEVYFFANSPSAVLGQESDGLVADEIGGYRSDTTLLNLSTGGGLAPDHFLKMFASNPPMTDDHFVLDMLKSCDADPDFVVHRFALKAKEDWTNEKNWAKANPFIAEYFRSGGKRFAYTMRFYRQYFNRALSSKSEENAFRRYLLGQFCGAETEYVPLEKIKTCDESIFREKGIRWVVGCDYSVVFDFTAISLIGWKRSEDKIFVKPFLFLPNTRKRRESQKLILEQWDRDNYITIQNCDVLDGEAVCDTVQNYLVDNKISPEIVTFDRALSAHHIEGFSNHKTEAIRGTARELTGGIREVERVAHSGGLYFVGGQNPCLKWMFGNCIVSQKSKNFVLLNRLSTAQNIDGPVSIVMGMRWLLNNEKKRPIIMAI